MKTLAEFKIFFSTELLPELRYLDSERKKSILKMFKNIAIYMLAIIILFAVGLLLNNMIYDEYLHHNTANIPLTIALIASISLSILMVQTSKKYRRQFVFNFKSRIISGIVKFINPELTYFPNDMISSTEFTRSRIFKIVPNLFYGDDLVTGKIDKTELAFSEIHALYKSHSHSDEDKDNKKRIFDGLFFKADFHKNFKGEYFIFPDKAEKAFGKIGQIFQKFNSSRGQLIKLEDPEFEKYFVVYGSDQVEARYILSTGIMQRILEFRKRANNDIFISFVDSNIYIAIPKNRRLFEPKYYSSVIDEYKATEYFSDLELAISIVEELNLNTRIWSKQ